MKMAHISDLHFGRQVDPKKLRSLERDLLSERPDLIVISGDITDRGHVGQFRQASAFFRSLEIPFISVPGNREISFEAVWEWLFPSMAMRRYSLFFGERDRILYLSDEHKVVFFGLNSVHPFPSWPD